MLILSLGLGEAIAVKTKLKKENKMQNIKLYKFKDVVEEGDANCLFGLIEDNGDRVLVYDANYKTKNNFEIIPTFVYLKNELVEVERR
jgi:hypothetical protein